MRVRKNILPPTTLSRPYFLGGRTVVKVDVGGNYRKSQDMDCSKRHRALDFYAVRLRSAGLQ